MALMIEPGQQWGAEPSYQKPVKDQILPAFTGVSSGILSLLFKMMADSVHSLPGALGATEREGPAAPGFLTCRNSE